MVNRSSDFIVTKSPHIAKRGNKLDTACKFGRNSEEDTNYPCNGTRSSCSKPHQGSQWATFRFYRFYPTSSSLFEQSLMSTPNQVTLQDSTTQGIPKNSANDIGRSHLSSLPERPPIAPPPRRIMVPHKSHPRNQVMADPSAQKMASTSTTNKRHTSMDNSPRPPKRLKDGGKDDMDTAGPSLLSRLTSNGSGSRAAVAKRSFSSHPEETNADSPLPPGGWSIKGAAKMAARTPSSPERTTDPPQRFSLLDRLESGLPAPSSGIPGGRKKKNWG